MWFDPFKQDIETEQVANFAKVANYQPDIDELTPKISRISKISREVISENINPDLPKLAELAELATTEDKETFVKCYDCLFFKSHHKHGKGSGECNGGGKYGSWAESLHQCEVFDARIEYFDYVIDETGLIVDCYTPNGALIKIQASSPGHAEWLKKMNPKRSSYGE